jgi:hypothetical protein
MMTKRALVPIAGKMFKHARSAYQRIPSTPSIRTGRQMEALTAIVFAATSLEAFINEIADLAAQPLYPEPPEPSFVAFAGLMEELEKSRASIVSKFWLGKWVLTAAPYDKGAPPYQDFALLIELRNTLVHSRSLDKLDYYDDEVGFVRTVETEAPTVITKLASKHILAELPGPSAVAWITLITTKATARWACNAASALVLSFLEMIPKSRYGDLMRRFYENDFSDVE